MVKIETYSQVNSDGIKGYCVEIKSLKDVLEGHELMLSLGMVDLDLRISSCGDALLIGRSVPIDDKIEELNLKAKNIHTHTDLSRGVVVYRSESIYSLAQLEYAKSEMEAMGLKPELAYAYDDMWLVAERPIPKEDWISELRDKISEYNLELERGQPALKAHGTGAYHDPGMGRDFCIETLNRITNAE